MRGLKNLTSARWWNAAATRALKTMCQTTIASIAVNTVWQINLREICGVAILAAVISLITSLAGIPEVTEDE